PALFATPPASACLPGPPGTAGPDRLVLDTYDAADQLIKVTTGYLSTSQIDYATATYTNSGEVRTVKDAANNLTTLAYDPYDRLLEVQFPMPATGSNASNPADFESYAYDNNGNAIVVRRRSGDRVSFTYDALNRLTLEHFAQGASQDVAFGYDLLDRTLFAHYGSPTGTGVDFAYDALGRAVSATASGRTLAYQYDAAGNRTRVTWPETGPNALFVAYAYDVLDRVTRVEEDRAGSGPGLLASYVYDDLGRRSSIARAGGTGAATSYGYDGASRLSGLTQTLAGGAGVDYTFTYNGAGQILTRAVTNDAYTAHPGTIASSYGANGLNQITGASGVTGTYDASNSAALSYDPLGRVQSSTAGGATTTFLWDGEALAGEYDPSGNILRRYASGPGVDEPVVWYEGPRRTDRRWLAADNAGSVIAYADQNGVSGATYAYGPYGEPLNADGSPAWGGARHRYTGQIELPEAHLY
ncbi:MAG: hypothetical protein ABI306_00990, partial [Caulobacteraceae bacterium]